MHIEPLTYEVPTHLHSTYTHVGGCEIPATGLSFSLLERVKSPFPASCGLVAAAKDHRALVACAEALLAWESLYKNTFVGDVDEVSMGRRVLVMNGRMEFCLGMWGLRVCFLLDSVRIKILALYHSRHYYLALFSCTI